MGSLAAVLGALLPSDEVRRRRAAWIAAALIVIAHAAFTFAKRRTHTGDFDILHDMGVRFLEGADIYGGGVATNYLPAAAMYHAPLALLPVGAAFALRYAVALVCLAMTMRWLTTAAEAVLPESRDRMFGIGATALLLCAQYLIRDLDDAGAHIVVLAMMVGGLHCLRHGRTATAAVWWGLAIAVKSTPGLLLPFLLWMRQWRAAALTAAAFAAWAVLPALWMGPAHWWETQSRFNAVALSVFSGQANRSRDDNELRPQNQSLRAAVLRLLVDYPPGHPMRPDVPGYATLGRMDPATAELVALAVAGALVTICVFRSRSRHPLEPTFPAESAGVILLMPLLSPVTWLQHLVFVLPALFWIQTERLAVARPRPAATALIWIYVLCALALNRELLGRTGALLVLSCRIHTVGMLILLALLLWLRPPSTAGAPTSTTGADPPRPPGAS
jgi:hypothetical protein